MNGRRIYHARGKVLGGSSQHQRDDLPARQPARLRALGRRPGHGARGTTRTACRTSSGWRPASRAPTSSAAATARSCSSAARPRTRCSRRSSRPCSRPATRSPTTSTATGRRASPPFDRNIHRGRRLSAARAYLHPVMSRPNLEVRSRAFVTRVLFEGDAGGRRRGRGQDRAGADRGRRGDPLRRRDQLAPAAPALRRRRRRRARGARHRRRPRPAGRRRAPPGPPRGLHPVRLEAAGLDGAGDEVAQPAVDRASSGCSSARARARRTTSRPAASSAATTTSPTRT